MRPGSGSDSEVDAGEESASPEIDWQNLEGMHVNPLALASSLKLRRASKADVTGGTAKLLPTISALYQDPDSDPRPTTTVGKQGLMAQTPNFSPLTPRTLSVAGSKTPLEFTEPAMSPRQKQTSLL